MPHPSSTNKSAVPGGVDRISALPDGVLEHVLGFLPADEAVQTSVLARRWRHLWRSMRRLHISNKAIWTWTADGFNHFVSGLLLLRDTSVVLDEVEFTHHPFQDTDGTYIDIWIQHILSCQAKVFVIRFSVDWFLVLRGATLVSRHLRKLDLRCLHLVDRVFDFASCPALEILELTLCIISCERMSSHSIKHLFINCTSFSCEVRTRISIPSLVSLQIIYFGGKTPFLEGMPSLQTARIKCAPFALGDYCDKGDSGECCGICVDCCGGNDQNSGCVLLGGFSSATNLELIADRGRIIFRRDLRWCPTFSKLKTLFLNEWCVANDAVALFCILRHSPVLEKLILQLAKQSIERDANFYVEEKSAVVSKQLKIIEVRCEMVDERVCQILKLPKALGMKFTLKRTKIKRFEDEVQNFELI